MFDCVVVGFPCRLLTGPLIPYTQARVFDCEEDMLDALSKDPNSFKGTVIVIRYEGPKVIPMICLLC